MKAFACGAVVPGCTATFTAPTEQEILARVAAHAKEDHGMEQVPADVLAQVRERIEEVAA
jgi:predicted small metal-binding protein